MTGKTKSKISKKFKKKTEGISHYKVWFAVGIVLLVVIVMGTIIYALHNEGREESEEGVISTLTLVPFIPIWTAVFIPFLTSRNKKKPSLKEEKWLMFAIAILVISVVLSTALILYVNIRN